MEQQKNVQDTPGVMKRPGDVHVSPLRFPRRVLLWLSVIGRGYLGTFHDSFPRTWNVYNTTMACILHAHQSHLLAEQDIPSPIGAIMMSAECRHLLP
jgi:hypothetical protein